MFSFEKVRSHSDSHYQVLMSFFFTTSICNRWRLDLRLHEGCKNLPICHHAIGTLPCIFTQYNLDLLKVLLHSLVKVKYVKVIKMSFSPFFYPQN